MPRKSRWRSHSAQGYFLVPADRTRRFGHRCGGTHDHESAACPSCQLPFLRYFHLDPRDPRVGLAPRGAPAGLPLLFCWPCQTRQLGYRVEGPRGIRVLRYEQDGACEDFPYPGYPTPFPECGVQLVRLTAAQQRLLREFNRGAPPRLPPELDRCRHQLAGEPYLVQRNPDTVVACDVCGRRMPFLLATGDAGPSGKPFVGYEWAQTLYFYCRRCRYVSAFQQCD